MPLYNFFTYGRLASVEGAVKGSKNKEGERRGQRNNYDILAEDGMPPAAFIMSRDSKSLGQDKKRQSKYTIWVC